MEQWLWAERTTSNRRKPNDSDRGAPSCVVTYLYPAKMSQNAGRENSQTIPVSMAFPNLSRLSAAHRSGRTSARAARGIMTRSHQFHYPYSWRYQPSAACCCDRASPTIQNPPPQINVVFAARSRQRALGMCALEIT